MQDQSSGAWVQFVIIVCLSTMLLVLLRLLLLMSEKWQNMMLDRIRQAKEKRKNNRDSFRTENGYSWDYCMVFQVYDVEDKLTEKQEAHSLKHILRELSEGGLQTRLFYSVDAHEVYCKIRAPIFRLMREADRIDYRLPFDSEALRLLCAAGRKDKWAPLTIPDTSEETSLGPYDYIYGRFETNRIELQNLYVKRSNNTIFRGVDRLKLIQEILKAKKRDGGCDFDVYKLIEEKSILAFFPMHDHVELRILEEQWLRFIQMPWNQPLDMVKDYFGEKIGVYFLFIGQYTTYLCVAGAVGFACWIDVASSNDNPNAVSLPYFNVFISIWTSVFLEMFKRKEKYYALRWGMVGFEEEQQPRPQFKGEPKRPSPITGKPVLFFDRNERFRRQVVSYMVITVAIILVIGVVVGIFVVRLILVTIPALVISGTQMGGIITSIINAVAIQVANILYGDVAISLTDYENHRTDTEYENSLIAKTFVFQFVNSFASLFYIAFVKPYIPEIDPCLKDCMSELQTSLGGIFLTNLAIAQIVELGVPAVTAYLKKRGELKKGFDEGDLSELERNMFQAEYHVMLGPFADYSSLVIQYGYATMFVSAFPLACIMSAVSNYIEIRVDAWKLCQQCRRTEPRSCEDIGTWFQFLEIISFFAVVTNSALCAFTSTIVRHYPWATRVWIFIGMTAGLVGLKLFILSLIPDVPIEVDIQLRREQYIVGKVLDDIPDDEDDPDNVLVPSDVEYAIRVTDDDPL